MTGGEVFFAKQFTHFLYLIAETSVHDIEEAFLQFTSRNDIAILLINQNVS